jgi:hypothetical protein
MTESSPAADRPPKTGAGQEAREMADEALDLAALDVGWSLPSARRCRITDLQHWIDLCA